MTPQEYPLITLRGYIVFWGCAFTLLTVAIALFKQETDHYTEAQERKRRLRHKKHKRSNNSSPAAKAARLEDGRANGVDGEGDVELDWSHRRAEIVTAYAKLWEVVSRAGNDAGCVQVLWQLGRGHKHSSAAAKAAMLEDEA